ncbi:MAG: hypothetical protein RMJ87_06210 [Cytophagales bacterium]|nr:hypothetical protein [Cytophagales bacterium]
MISPIFYRRSYREVLELWYMILGKRSLYALAQEQLLMGWEDTSTG